MLYLSTEDLTDSEIGWIFGLEDTSVISLVDEPELDDELYTAPPVLELPPPLPQVHPSVRVDEQARTFIDIPAATYAQYIQIHRRSMQINVAPELPFAVAAVAALHHDPVLPVLENGVDLDAAFDELLEYVRVRHGTSEEYAVGLDGCETNADKILNLTK